MWKVRAVLVLLAVATSFHGIVFVVAGAANISPSPVNVKNMEADTARKMPVHKTIATFILVQL